ncbi:hypothetical protein FEM48_Zijuj03G0067900 [Ziziphus jujuba var. spinosa]|uniref:Glycosyltransferase N-terminal domain-containing protein n=1 Tax=Ziziphus jujuba var. spinosa TaxID=714518 RepID=A0A978VNT1_ZIZJJ|nr:hypothetical protein FEM48_Zijuj03G0067900 [Ziziphus jujuba var. spinosa]
MATADHHNAIEKTSVIVVIVPFPVHSHSNQLLQLSALISSYNVPVHYAGSASDNSQVRARASHGLNLSEIHFHDFPIPPFVPHPTKIPTEKFLLPYFHAVEQLREPVGDLLRDLSTKAERIIVIHDSISSSAVQDVSSIKNAESYTFQATTAFSILCFVSLEFGSKFLPIPKEAEIVSSDNPIEIPSTEGAFSYETANFIANQQQFMRYAVGDLYNGCRLIDGAFLDHFVKNIQNNIKKAWSIGPLHHELVNELSSKAKRIIIVHDALTSSAVQDAISRTNAETSVFQPTTAFAGFCFLCAECSKKEKTLPVPSELE